VQKSEKCPKKQGYPDFFSIMCFCLNTLFPMLSSYDVQLFRGQGSPNLFKQNLWSLEGYLVRSYTAQDCFSLANMSGTLANISKLMKICPGVTEATLVWQKGC
jgi:hypothetical protein